MNHLTENDFYRTTDLALCTALVCFGYSIDAIERNKNSGRVTFLIKRDPNIDEVVSKIFAGELLVHPFIFFNNLKTVKTRIYNSEE